MRYYTLEEFKELRDYGRGIGFKWVESAPLVRSSYHAAEQVRALSKSSANPSVDAFCHEQAKRKNNPPAGLAPTYETRERQTTHNEYNPGAALSSSRLTARTYEPIFSTQLNPDKLEPTR